VSSHAIRLTVNGSLHELEVTARLTLADLLRESLDLTGTHLGCEHGVCGVCTVLLNGRAVRSCLTLAVQAHEAEVVTIEGIGTRDTLHPIQQAFWERHGTQCGFCTPAFIVTTLELSSREPPPTREEVLEALGGVLCRCTGYVKIVEAVEQALGLTGAPSR
jgi:carbon-monoxide dehydrogenase small subunit